MPSSFDSSSSVMKRGILFIALMNSSVVVFFTPAMAGGRAAPGAAVVGVGVACRATASSTRRDMSRFSLLTPGGSSVIMAIVAKEVVVASCLGWW